MNYSNKIVPYCTGASQKCTCVGAYLEGKELQVNKNTKNIIYLEKLCCLLLLWDMVPNYNNDDTQIPTIEYVNIKYYVQIISIITFKYYMLAFNI